MDFVVYILTDRNGSHKEEDEEAVVVRPVLIPKDPPAPLK